MHIDPDLVRSFVASLDADKVASAIMGKSASAQTEVASGAADGLQRVLSNPRNKALALLGVGAAGGAVGAKVVSDAVKDYQVGHQFNKQQRQMGAGY